MKKILVVGGAGYIGSHMLLSLRAAGFEPVVLDNLSTGHADVVLGATLVHGDVGNPELLEKLFQTHAFSAVMHFAACSQVAESINDPLKYYRNNVAATMTLLQAMVRHKVDRLVVSSTAAIYGHPAQERISESTPPRPINPYGHSKLMLEQLVADTASAHGLRFAVLRYFNAAGADPQGRLGERHEPETHLIPLVLQAAAGRRPNIHVFGQDYDTPDGTCIRDYVHVEDLCQAHLLALQSLMSGSASGIFNLGNDRGYSVAEVIAAARRITGAAIPVVVDSARRGDPPRLVADSRQARRELGWQPHHASLDTMIRHAWRWEQRNTAADGKPAAPDTEAA